VSVPIDDAGDLKEGSTGDAGPACLAVSVTMLTWANNLYEFDPGKLTFKKIGNLSCLPKDFSAFSMAVDRDGIAWIEGWVYGPPLKWYLQKVNTTDASCVGTLPLPGTHNFETAGGGETFVTNTKDSTAETLYSAELAAPSGNGTSFGLSSISTSNGAVTPVGTLNSDPASGMSLTGTGDARMFAAESPVSGTNIIFTERDKSTAMPISTANVTIPASYIVVGMVFWGGDFWFFLRPTQNAPWQVGRYRTSDQSFTIEVKDIAVATGEQGLGVTAVAISTCAPLLPPK
jgi:hypothetical protein